MALNKLKMNDTKTEAILIGNSVQLKICETACISVGTSNIEIQQCIKYLGVILDENLNLKNILLINVRQPHSTFIKYIKLARTAALKT